MGSSQTNNQQQLDLYDYSVCASCYEREGIQIGFKITVNFGAGSDLKVLVMFLQKNVQFYFPNFNDILRTQTWG